MDKRTIFKLLKQIENPDPNIQLIINELENDLKDSRETARYFLAIGLGIILGSSWVIYCLH